MESIAIDLGKLNEEGFDIYEDFRKQRRLILDEEITESVVAGYSLMIAKWNAEDKDILPEKRKKIVIFIHSPGGDVISGFNLLDVIDSSETPIITIGMGECASMASYVLAAGHERYCYPNTVVLIHDGEQGYQTSAGKGKDIQAFFDKQSTKMRKYLATHTNMDEEYLKSVEDREVYLFGDEAKEKGIVDGLIGVDVRLTDVIG